MDVYADLLFLVNFSMDFLCLYLSVKLLHLPRVRWRMLVAGAIGGVYSVVALVVSVESWLSLVPDLGVCLGMCAVCAAGKGVRMGRLLLLCGTYFGISALMGGGMTAIYHLLGRADLPLDEVPGDGISAWMFLFLATAAALTASFGGRLFSRQSAVKSCTVHVKLDNVAWKMAGLYDSGNLLRDPISGTPVIIADRQTWILALPDALQRAVESEGRELDRLEGGKRVRIVPMHTAHGSSMAVALLPDEILLVEQDGKTRAVHALIAPSAEPLGGDYRAIVPATLLQ